VVPFSLEQNQFALNACVDLLAFVASILGEGYIAYGITHKMLSGFRYGRTQHVRRMRSSIVSVIHYVSTRYFISHVM